MTVVREPELARVDRFASSHYEPDRVPPEVSRYRGIPDTLGVGRPGKVGLLELGFERVGGRTELVRRYQKSPLQIMRPLYIDPRRPDLPVVYLMSTGGGILQADRLRLDIDCGADTSVSVTTQAATKVHRMDRDYATSLVHLSAGPGAYLEYLPGPLIPYGGTRIYQRTAVTAAPDATVVIAETVMAGRLARGERHDYDVVASDLEIVRPGGEPVVVDAVRLDPTRAAVTGPGVMGRSRVMSTLYAVGPSASPAALADAMHDVLAGHPVMYGVSVLPHDAGAWVRILADDPPAVSAAVRVAWDAVRRVLIGVPAPALRKT